MGTDFYPRLTAAIHDRASTVRLHDEPLAQSIAGDEMLSSTA